MDAAIQSKSVLVTVFANSGMGRLASRYFVERCQTATVAPTLTVSVSGSSVTIAGTITPGNVVGVQFGTAVLASAFAYVVKLGDSVISIAASLAALIPGATHSLATVTIATNLPVGAAVMTPQPVMLETRRQEQVLSVICFAPNPALRDAACSAIDAGIAGLQRAGGTQTMFVPLPDGSAAWIRYSGTRSYDTAQVAGLYRRDINYLVEYPTTLIEMDPQMLFGGISIATVNDNVLAEFGQQQPPASIETDVNGNLYADAAGNLMGVPPS